MSCSPVRVRRAGARSRLDRFDLDLGVARAEAGPTAAVLPAAVLADRQLRPLRDGTDDLRGDRRARDERRADAPLDLAAEEAHLVEGDRAPGLDAVAQVDLDAVAGLDPVLLIPIVDDGVHGASVRGTEGGAG